MSGSSSHVENFENLELLERLYADLCAYWLLYPAHDNGRAADLEEIDARESISVGLRERIASGRALRDLMEAHADEFDAVIDAD